MRRPVPTLAAMAGAGLALLTFSPASTAGAGFASLSFSAEQAGSRELREKVNDASPAPGTLVAAGEEAGGLFAGRPDVTVIAAAKLPRSARAYLPVAALAIGGEALHRMDDARLRALLDFVGYCGRAVFVNVERRAFEAITAHAGCGGRYTARAQGADAVATFDRLLARTPRPLPGTRALRGLVGAAHPELELAGWFLGGFLLLFLLLAALRPARSIALPFCVLATALPGLLWAGGSRQASAIWAEARADDAIARYVRLDVAAALGRGDERLTPAALAATPRAIDGPGVVLHWGDLPQERRIEWSAAFLQELRLTSVGHLAAARGLRAQAAGDVIRVCNTGRVNAPGGWLHWRGDTWRVPALAPGATWIPSGPAPASDRTPAIRLFERRSPENAPALLQRIEKHEGAGSAWLMRTEAETHGARPCPG